MTTARVIAAGPRPFARLWNRSLNRYPANPTRYLSILRSLHMSFTYCVNISVVGYLLGAAASVIAGLADRSGRAHIVTAGLALVGLLCLPQAMADVLLRRGRRRGRVHPPDSADGRLLGSPQGRAPRRSTTRGWRPRWARSRVTGGREDDRRTELEA